MLHLLADLNREGIAVVLTTHDLNSVAAHLPWVICLNKRIVAQGTPDEVFTPEILGRTYGAEMVVVRQGDLILVRDRLSATRSGTADGDGAESARRVIAARAVPLRVLHARACSPRRWSARCAAWWACTSCCGG